jgi:undecaprenol kinase
MHRSFRVAIYGIRHATSERNVRIHLFIAVFVMTAGVYFELQVWEWCLVVLAMGLVLSTELLNTAIEQLANVVRDQNHLSRGATKLTRDISAGAVLIASISSAIVGLLIFIPKIFA